MRLLVRTATEFQELIKSHDTRDYDSIMGAWVRPAARGLPPYPAGLYVVHTT